ncbi:MAG: hypothetical protein ABI367_08115 [Mucilaginibacter sp.]
MTPSPEQLKLLQDNLRKVLTYRETYEEVYDHILSALANEPDNINIGDALNKIIQNDFGGYEKLSRLEKTIKRALVKDTLRKYSFFLISYFEFPVLIYTVGLSLLFIYFSLIIKVNYLSWSILFSIPIFAPGIIVNIRHFKKGYILGDTKQSARDRIFRTISRIPMQISMFVFFTSIHYKFNYNQVSIAIIFIILNIHVLAMLKLYNYEFKKISVNR